MIETLPTGFCRPMASLAFPSTFHPLMSSAAVPLIRSSRHPRFPSAAVPLIPSSANADYCGPQPAER